MGDFTNGLTPEQNELLTLLAEECAEVVQAVAKIQRHGLNSCYGNGETNIVALHKELGDVRAATMLLERIGVVNPALARQYGARKLQRVGQFLHHHTVVDPGLGAHEAKGKVPP